MLKFSKKENQAFILRIFPLPIALIMTVGLFFLPVAYGAEYPSRTIQIIVPVTPGGPTDTTARIMSKRLHELLGQRIVVVNKTGGGQAIGIQAVLAEPPDGHTILDATNSIVVLPQISKGLDFTLKDFTPINLATSAPICMIVKKDSPWTTLEEFVAYAKKNPNKITYSSPGPGSGTRIAAELFQIATGTKLTHIPYSGASVSLTAVLGGQVNMSFTGYQLVEPHVEAGTLRMLAVLQDKRLSKYPAVPTFPEKGYQSVVWPNWVGFFVPAKTPAAITNKLNTIFQNILKEKQIVEQIEKAGLTVDNLPQKEAAKYLAAQEANLKEVVKIANITPQ